MTRNTSLRVWVFFKEESHAAVLLKKAAQLLHEMGVDVSFSFEEEPSEEEIEQIKENHILALFHNPEKQAASPSWQGKQAKKASPSQAARPMA